MKEMIKRVVERDTRQEEKKRWIQHDKNSGYQDQFNRLT